jgi:hypothetical protein
LKGIIAKWLLHEYVFGTTVQMVWIISLTHILLRRIHKVYGRKAAVIYPPVDVERFSLCEQKQDYYFTASKWYLQKDGSYL